MQSKRKSPKKATVFFTDLRRKQRSADKSAPFSFGIFITTAVYLRKIFLTIRFFTSENA